MKHCLNCGQKFKKWGDLKKYCCKHCADVYWIKNHPENRIKAIRKYNASAKQRANSRKYYNSHKEEHEKYRKSPFQKLKNNARTRAKYAMKKANITKICSECSSNTRIHVHHIDFNTFNNSLSNLTYLCPVHHGLRHRTVIGKTALYLVKK